MPYLARSEEPLISLYVTNRPGWVGGDEIKEIVAGLGYPMRIYVPTGTYARGLNYAGRRFSELVNKDNALAGNLRGECSHLEGPPPVFVETQDIEDGQRLKSLVTAARDHK